MKVLNTMYQQIYSNVFAKFSLIVVGCICNKGVVDCFNVRNLVHKSRHISFFSPLPTLSPLC